MSKFSDKYIIDLKQNDEAILHINDTKKVNHIFIYK